MSNFSLRLLGAVTFEELFLHLYVWNTPLRTKNIVRRYGAWVIMAIEIFAYIELWILHYFHLFSL